MKVRDSGMPDVATWDGFFDPVAVLGALVFDPHADVVDFGSGYGTFTVAAARMTTGTVYAVDVDPAMVAATSVRATALGLGNVRVVERDFVSAGVGPADSSVGYAMLFNVLHAVDPMPMIRESCRVLKPAGRLAVIHWIHDASTPRGPELAIRARADQCRQWLEDAGCEIWIPFVDLPPWHFGVVGERR